LKKKERKTLQRRINEVAFNSESEGNEGLKVVCCCCDGVIGESESGVEGCSHGNHICFVFFRLPLAMLG
jgi:hypothetical protein